jgi:DNA repair exonuclease SbcCD ATPase subunit
MADPMAGSQAMSKSVGLDARIAAAFTEAATSDEVGRLLAEVEAAANAADAVAKEARTRALDPLLSRDDVNGARREMDDASFTWDRLTEAARRLGERVAELRAFEKASAQRAEHERVSAERDRLAAELDRMATPISEIAGLVTQIDACDRSIRNLNATTGLALGHIRPVLAGAAPVIGTLLADGVTRDSFIAVARLKSPPVTKGKANPP